MSRCNIYLTMRDMTIELVRLQYPKMSEVYKEPCLSIGLLLSDGQISDRLTKTNFCNIIKVFVIT